MLKKIIVLAVIFAALSFTVPVLADEPTATPSPTPTPIPYQVLNINVQNVDLNSAYYYFNEVLTSDQKSICAYLVGSYNYMYLKSRGFEYDNISDADDLLDRLIEFGTKFFSDGFKNASRYNSSFQRYLVSIINYSGTINISFLDWVNSQTDEFYIPYTVEGLNAWTDFYNDPSQDGIINFGYEETPWVSGLFYDNEYANYSWMYSYEQSNFNSSVLNYSPGIYTNIYQYRGDNYQSFVSLKDANAPDTLFVQRGNNGYQFFRFGYSNKTLINQEYYLFAPSMYLMEGKVRYDAHTFTFRRNIINYGSAVSFLELVDYAFSITPINAYNAVGYYPYITHVILVDDLNTLSNAVEVQNADDLEIAGENAHWIKTPNGQVLLFPGRPSAVYELNPDRLEDILLKPDPKGTGNLVPIDPDNDIIPQIVNNTVINNYDIVAPGVVINVPVDWFDGDYLDYTYNTGLPFFVFVGDVFNSLGEIRIIILGVLIFGLVSGIIVKFLQ